MIPLLDTKAQYQSLKSEIDAAVLAVLASGHYVLGEEVAALVQDLLVLLVARGVVHRGEILAARQRGGAQYLGGAAEFDDLGAQGAKRPLVDG